MSFAPLGPEPQPTELATAPPPAEPAPPDEPTERDLAWFYKLFSLRGISEGIEQMCFFTYLQKSGDTLGNEE